MSAREHPRYTFAPITGGEGDSAPDPSLQKPIPIKYTFGKIPTYLRERPQWVNWRYTLMLTGRGEPKWTKVPCQATRLGVKAISNKRETWATFEQAVAA